MTFDPEHLRMMEAMLFAAAEPLSEAQLASRLPEGVATGPLLVALQEKYAGAGVNLVHRGKAWLFQTAPDLAFLMRQTRQEVRKLSRAAVETLAVVAYHQYDRKRQLKGVSRAEIEDIRNVGLSKGTLDVLIEAGWVKPVGRRAVPGRPVVYGTTPAFLVHFGLESIEDLPGLDDLRSLGMLDPFEQSLSEMMGDKAPESNEEPELPLGDIEPEEIAELPDM